MTPRSAALAMREAAIALVTLEIERLDELIERETDAGDEARMEWLHARNAILTILRDDMSALPVPDEPAGADENARLAGCLIAISEADENAPASVLRGIAYDSALNCISAEVAEFQIKRRTELAPIPAPAPEVDLMGLLEALNDAIADCDALADRVFDGDLDVSAEDRRKAERARELAYKALVAAIAAHQPREGRDERHNPSR